MAIRRPTAPRKRQAPLPQNTVLGRESSDVAAKEGHGDSQFDFDEAKRQVLQEFKSALNQTARQSSEDGDSSFATHFESALDALSEEDALKPISASNLKNMLEQGSLSDTASMNTLDAADVARKLDEALRSLERRETQLALEFGRRMQADGQELALHWLQEQIRLKPESADADANASGSDSQKVDSLNSDTVKSRSRRLRGPPRI